MPLLWCKYFDFKVIISPQQLQPHPHPHRLLCPEIHMGRINRHLLKFLTYRFGKTNPTLPYPLWSGSLSLCLTVLLGACCDFLKWILLGESLEDSAITETAYQSRVNIIKSSPPTWGIKEAQKQNLRGGGGCCYVIETDFPCCVLPLSCFSLSTSALYEITRLQKHLAIIQNIKSQHNLLVKS